MFLSVLNKDLLWVDLQRTCGYMNDIAGKRLNLRIQRMLNHVFTWKSHGAMARGVPEPHSAVLHSLAPLRQS